MLSARHQNHAGQRKNDSGDSRGRNTITPEPGKEQCQGRITGRERGDDSHLPDFKRAVQRKCGTSIETTGQESPGPGPTARAVGEVPTNTKTVSGHGTTGDCDGITVNTR